MSPDHAQTESDALGRFAEFAIAQRIEVLPPEVLAKAKDCIIDALSASLTVGSALEGRCAVTVAEARASSDAASVFGTAIRTTPAEAAFVNAVTAFGTARSDTHVVTACHPGSVMIPVAFALAEARGRPGRAVVEAIVSGYEAMCRLGEALITPEFAAIFRPTGMLAPTGAAIAAARVMGLPAREMRHAASLATHTAAGLNEWSHSGTTELAFHSGFAARNGVDCALLAECGAISATRILEGKAGLLAGYGALSRAARLTEGLGGGHKILEITHKPAPACIYVQTPCQAIQALLRAKAPDPHAIDTIEIAVGEPAARYPGCDDNGPITSLQSAKMSIQFAVASVIVNGGIFDSNWRNFTEPRATELASRIVLRVDDALTAASPKVGCSIRITLKNGEVVEEHQDDFRSMTSDEVTERFLAVAAPKLGGAASQRIVETVRRIETLDDIRELTSLLAA